MGRLARSLMEREMVRFLVTGIGAAGLFAVLSFLALRSGLPPFPGTLLAYAATVTASYTVQRGWTFGGRHAHGRAFPRYLAAQVACAGVTAALAQGLTRLGLTAAAVSVTITLVGSALSFGLSRLWVFPPGRAA